jgi:PEP-CTERM motif
MKLALIAGLVTTSVLSSATSAHFRMRDIRQTFTSGSTQYDRVTFYVRNDGVGGTGTAVSAFELTRFNTSGAMRFTFADIGSAPLNPVSGFGAPDDYADASIFATSAQLSARTSTAFNTSFWNGAGAFYTPTAGNLRAFSPNPWGSETYSPQSSYSGLRSMYVLAIRAPAASQGLPADSASGLPLMTIVVPKNASIEIGGEIASNATTIGQFLPWDAPAGSSLSAFSLSDGGSGTSSGNIANGTAFNYLSVVPEPASLAALSLLGVVARRRRA